MKIFTKSLVSPALLSLCLVLTCIAANATTTSVGSPVNGAVGVAPQPLTITAKMVTGAGSYKIDISTDPMFLSGVQTHSAVSNSQIFVDLMYGKKYYTRVSIDGGVSYGAVTYFTTAQPIVSSPAYGSSVSSPVSVMITSKTVPNASVNGYTIDISTSSTFATIFQTHSGSNSLVFTDLAYGTKYYARVKATLLKSDGMTSYGYGPTVYFSTAPLAVTSPMNGTTGLGPASLMLTAKPVTNASTYTFDISTSSTFNPIFQTQGGASNSQTFTDLAYGTKYYARVKTDLLKSDGLTSYGYGTTTYFVTASPDVSSPANGATNVSTSAMITSKTVPGATAYTIEVSPDATFKTNVMSSIPGSNTQPFALAGNTKYYVRVKTDLVMSTSIPYGYGKVSSFTTGALPGVAQQSDLKNSSVARMASSPVKDANPEIKSGELEVFPNPSSSCFQVLVNSEAKEDMLLNIYDLSGNQLHSSSQKTNTLIEVGHDFKVGMYILKVSTPSGTSSVKLIKE